MTDKMLQDQNARLADLACAVGPLSMAGDHDPIALAAAAVNYKLLRDCWCQCQPEGDTVYFRNPLTGTHGWMCFACRGITQMG